MSMSAGMDMYPRWVLDVPVISCGRGFTSDVIAEYVLGAMLNHEKGFLRHRVRSSSAMETSWVGSLKGATLGIAGFGSIGGEVARRALAFGMNIRAYRRSDTALPDGIKAAASLRDLAGFSDHLVIAMPLTEETRKSIGRKVFQAAKPGLHLVNVSRGAILDLDALRRSLETGTVAAATLDVTDPEPLPEGHWAYGDERFIITPHMSWQGGAETEARKLDTLAENLRRIMDGREILNRFDACRGY
ncbi:NAD(P)-dependent oxidoreductase [Marinovum algicola]|nr:NAD(P)-dependent oxidoreductase [Marinovum algicola]